METIGQVIAALYVALGEAAGQEPCAQLECCETQSRTE
jgi:hypothetical protein